MCYYWLYVKDDQGRVLHTFLLEEADAASAMERAARIDCGEAWVEVWDEKQLIARERRTVRVAEPA